MYVSGSGGALSGQNTSGLDIQTVAGVLGGRERRNPGNWIIAQPPWPPVGSILVFTVEWMHKDLGFCSEGQHWPDLPADGMWMQYQTLMARGLGRSTSVLIRQFD